MLHVEEIVKEATAAVSRIASASKDQSNAIAYVSEGIAKISAVVQSNSATSHESAAASEELSSQAYIMKELVDKFQLFELDKLK